MAARSRKNAPGQDSALSPAQFESCLQLFLPQLQDKAIAVAVSGGGDSMALAWLLQGWARKNGKNLHVLTVDHGLRPEAAAEAEQVKLAVSDWGCIHKTLEWSGEKPSTRIQEEARLARYHLMAEYCRDHKIRVLFLGHHADDQVETILFRLAKGSGLDGLVGMSRCQKYSDDLILLRPLLDYSHKNLLAVCQQEGIIWIEDKSNVSDLYSRIRLRKSMEILEAEGLSSERIRSLGSRLERARNALDQVTDMYWEKSILEKDTDKIVFNFNELLAYPEEIVLRILLRALSFFRPSYPYPPRLENAERLAERMLDPDQAFRGATLGGCEIRVQRSKGLLTVLPETTA